MKSLGYVPLLATCLILSGCGDDVVGPSESAGPDPSDVSLYKGSIGLIIDVRPIFKKGYFPSEADVSFPDQPAFDTTLDVDPLTNLAILIIQNDSLSEDQRTAFESDVTTNIVISDSTQAVLASLVGESVRVNESNVPMTIDNDDLPALAAPLVLAAGMPYLLNPADFDGVLTNDGKGNMNAESFVPDAVAQEFNLTGTGDPNTYLVENFTDPANSVWCVFKGLLGKRELFLHGRLSDGSACSGFGYEPDPAQLVLEADVGGWVRLRLGRTGEYAVYVPPTFFFAGEVILEASRDRATRFRLISGALEWTVLDRGTAFNQPIIPPARLDFAFQATLTNCSAATLTETIGTQVTRTRRTTFGTSESLQLFAGVEASASMSVGASTVVPVAGYPVNVEAQVETSLKVTTSLTYQTGNTFEETQEVQTQVSRSRELVIPPFSALIASDLVRTVSNVVTPFTQRLRIRARNRETARALSGSQIRTQIESGFFEGVITKVGGDYVEVSIRGEARTDQFIQAETTVLEVPNACD